MICGVVSRGLLVGARGSVLLIGESGGVGVDGCSCWLMSILSFCEERILPRFGAWL